MIRWILSGGITALGCVLVLIFFESMDFSFPKGEERVSFVVLEKSGTPDFGAESGLLPKKMTSSQLHSPVLSQKSCPLPKSSPVKESVPSRNSGADSLKDKIQEPSQPSREDRELEEKGPEKKSKQAPSFQAPSQADIRRSSSAGTRSSGKQMPVDKALKNYKKRILGKIARKKNYPLRARRREEEGRVKIHLVIEKNGKMGLMEILQSSSYPLLDEAALQAVKKAAPFPGLPPGHRVYEISFFMEFKLN